MRFQSFIAFRRDGTLPKLMYCPKHRIRHRLKITWWGGMIQEVIARCPGERIGYCIQVRQNK